MDFGSPTTEVGSEPNAPAYSEEFVQALVDLLYPKHTTSQKRPRCMINSELDLVPGTTMAPAEVVQSMAAVVLKLR